MISPYSARPITPFVRRLDDPVITSLLQTDFYKFTMGQFIHQYYPDVDVTFALKNRSLQIRIADIVPIEALKEQFQHLRSLRFTESEIAYLRGIDFYGERMFCEDYLKSLRTVSVPEPEIIHDKEAGQYNITFYGKWENASHSEIPELKIVVELTNRYYLKGLGLSRFEMERLRADGIRRAEEFFWRVKDCGAFWSDFGTRRTFGVDWHRFMVESAMEYFAGTDLFRGTSDTYLAMILGIPPIGTNAHELTMVAGALAGYDDREAFIESQREVLRRWWALYGPALSIALTDTFSSDFFYREVVGDMDQFWKEWKGSRQDSGDPEEYYRKNVAYYQAHGIDPANRMIVPSDGLTGEKVARYQHSMSRMLRTFGVGTHFSYGLDPNVFPIMSIVSKAVEANGVGTVKLSDNIAKAIGKPEDIEKVKKLVGYSATFSEQPVV